MDFTRLHPKGKVKSNNTANQSEDVTEPDTAMKLKVFSSAYDKKSGKYWASDGLTWDCPFHADQIKRTWDSENALLTVTYHVNMDYFPRFLDLPGEVRNMIYDLVLVQSSPNHEIRIEGGCTRNDSLHAVPWGGWRNRIAALVKVNRQIRQEATPYLYRNYLIFQRQRGLRQFLTNATPYIVHMRHLSVLAFHMWEKSAVTTIFSLLANAKSLEAVEIVIRGSISGWLEKTRHSPTSTALGFLEAMIRRKGSISAGLGVLRFKNYSGFMLGQDEQSFVTCNDLRGTSTGASFEKLSNRLMSEVDE